VSREPGPWPLDPAVTFLNHGSFGSCPRPVLDAQRAWRDQMESEPITFFDRDLPSLLADARAPVAAFLVADPEDLVFVPNATTAVSTVLGSLRFEPGDELLTTDHEYNATLNALRRTAARDGASVVVARIPFPISDPGEALEAIVRAVTRRTRLALVSHITSPTALVLPIAAIVSELDRRGVDTLVDAAHAPGMVPIDLRSLGAAYWTGNAHKWLCAPKGAAVLHVRSDRRATIRPLVVSHGANDPRVERGAYRNEFEWLGTSDPTAYLSVPAAIDFVASLDPEGWSGVMRRNADLARLARDVLCACLGVALPAPDSMLGAMAAVPLPGPTPSREVALDLRDRLLDEYDIEVAVVPWPVPAALESAASPRALVVRVSAQLYNTLADYERLGEALAERPLREELARAEG